MKEMFKIIGKLFSSHYSPLTAHYSLFTIHHSLFTTNHSLLTIHYSPFTIHYSLFTMFISETTIRVRYAETDQMDIVYYGNYAQYFEVGRAESIRQLGYTYKDMEAMGIRMPFMVPSHGFGYPLLVKTNCP